MMLGRFDNLRLAQAFSDYLRSQRLPHRLERGEHGLELWVDDEAVLERVRSELARFRANPDDARYYAASWSSPPPPEAARRLARRYGDVAGDLAPARLLRSRGPVTLAVLFACLGVAAWTGAGSREEALLPLLFPEQGGLFASGEPWRVLTPALLHFGGVHLVFNLLWWWILGGIIERFQSSFQLAMLTVGIALVSNGAQFWVDGPNFGGLSGVIYGLIGYLWLYGLVNPRAGYQLRPAIVGFMLAWLVLGFTGLVGPVANTAHLAGLVTGAVLGVVFGAWRRRFYYGD